MLEYNKYSDDELKQYWSELGNIPFDEHECIEEEFYFFPVGTDKSEIWQWFDQKHSVGTYKLMHPDAPPPKTAEAFIIKWGIKKARLALGYAEDLDLEGKGLIPELKTLILSHDIIEDLGGLAEAEEHLKQLVNSGVSLTSRELVIDEAIEDVKRCMAKNTDQKEGL